MKNVGICTLYTGFNYGSTLQAFAVKVLVRECGYNPVVIAPKKSFIKGRNINFSKAFTIFVRRLFHIKSAKGAFRSYLKSPSSQIDKESKQKFLDFYSNFIVPSSYSNNQLKKAAMNGEFLAFVCGSDQIWSSSVLYVDKRYYLRFCNYEKRIAFAPSLGSNLVPVYNKKILTKYISQIRFISVRENSGQKIIKELTGIDATLISDPTLLLCKNDWINYLNISIENKTDKIAVIYFLDEINSEAKEYIAKLVDYDYKLLYIGPRNNCSSGPIEFVKAICAASYVVTDSFHGTAFAINFGIPFAVFSRNYKTKNQSTRIISLLEYTGLKDCFDPKAFKDKINFNLANNFLSRERFRCKKYLMDCLEEVNKNECK